MSLRSRAGHTLLEVLVTIVLMGLVAGVVTFTWPGALDDPVADPDTSPHAAIADARSRAIRERRTVTITVAKGSGTPVLVTTFPDGRVWGASELGFDESSGSPVPDSARQPRGPSR